MSLKVSYTGMRALELDAPPTVERVLCSWPKDGEISYDATPLDLRRDLAPGLPIAFDWGRLGSRARCDRLAVAILADALVDRADGDDLALRHFREFAREHVDRFDDMIFEFSAWDVTRWIADREDTRREYATTSRVRQPQLPRRA